MIAWVLAVSAGWAIDPSVGSDWPFEEEEARGHLAVEPEPVFERPDFLLRGGTVMTATGHVWSPGYVWVAGGKIKEAGEGRGPDPANTAIIDATGMWVTPGLIDTHSHLGVYPSPEDFAANGDGNEATSPTTPGVWAEHSDWPQDPGFERAIAGGITAMELLPGSANLVGGRGFVVENVPTRGSRAMAFPGAPTTVKMACGENPKRVYGDKGGPSTRMGNIRGQREAFLDAESYLRRWQAYDAKKQAWDGKVAAAKKSDPAGDPPDPPGRDLDLETLAGILMGKYYPEVHCYRADDMLAFLQIAHEFGFQVRSFHHALEAYKIRDVLAAEGVAVSTWADWWGFKLEALDGIPENLGLVTQAGARAIVHSDSAIGIQRLNQEAGKALAAARASGIEITDDQALKWLTINPAWALGIDASTGSLEPGKRADLAVWDHLPFSVYAHARWVWVDGALRYDMARDREWSDYLVGQDVGR